MVLDEVKSLTPLSFGNETKAGEVPKRYRGHSGVPGQ